MHSWSMTGRAASTPSRQTRWAFPTVPSAAAKAQAQTNAATNPKIAAILPLLKTEKVGAYNWGFVNGKSQTIYPWDSWEKTYTAEPPVWFHDIFRQNGDAYDNKEVVLIRQLTK